MTTSSVSTINQRVALIGSGHVGATSAYSLVRRAQARYLDVELDEIFLRLCAFA
jgi:glycine/D-amino acid oxidase-like deaminating enzyme